MRDLFFVGYLGLLMLMAFKRPFLFTLVYAYIDIIAPQRLSYFLLNSIPLSLILFALAFLGFLVSDDKRDVRVSPRWALLLVLLAYCGYSTTVAVEPLAAQEKWSWVWKALVFAAFLPLLLKTKLRIEALALTLVLCASALIVTGGIKTALGGGGYGSLVLLINDNSGLYEGSIISCVAIAIIPLIVWLAQHGTIFKPDWKVKTYAAALTVAALLIPVGTQARTGLVCIAVLALLFIRQTKRRVLYLSGAALVGLAAIPFIPSAFSDRMETIKDYKTDESASTRIAVWKWTWEFVQEHPFGGGFDAYRINKIRYDLPVVDENGFDTGAVDRKEIVDQGRAYHSSYFEMLGEQGFPGLIIWLLIHVGGVWRMEMIARMYKKRDRPDEQWVAPLATALQNAQIIYLVGSLFVGIAFQPFVYMLVAMQLGLDTYLARRRNEAAWTPIRKQRLKAKEISATT
ncbi:putative O-glycosylation ligase, exosortase A system-associated [Sphingorhabdus sp.]|jgi:probable O-glycosylation ligase (exosortase A-associated)|uniref:putative O-glycosylation ligase, exosortase A system-associated n=1 Tax=Sphingorhabdus sp. TaxID=1902408 RepID=UPI002C7462B0|nr:putative O-glycosylation ligase, exosortase A system-associated [Sphingorhabdus sp.]HMT41994.1 putative O-glycosylation ligase, exosortase A system-associated [Sphingorhabdus sp.]